MKRVIYLFVLSTLVLFACSKNEKENVTSSLIENEAAIKFERDLIDFKELSDGETVTGSFKFQNTGKYDLVISEVTTSCGCTVADYPKDPIKPSAEGMITVTYDSRGYRGKRITKEVTVVSNTKPSTTKLHIIADVK